MVNTSLWLRCSLLLLVLGLPFTIYGEKAEDIFEKETEEKVEANATFFITPKGIKQNYRKYHQIDRSIKKMDRFTVAEQYNYNFQNLGNHGTAAQYIFYTLPKRIGATYGLPAYDFYFQNPQDIRYYVTHRAYAHFNIILANLGSFIFDSCYSHRLLENWHIGVNVRSAMTEKEWPREKDVKIVNAFPHFDVFTHIKTPDESYHLFTSFSNMRYLTSETGGVCSTKYGNKFEFGHKNPSYRYSSSLPFLEEAYMTTKVLPKHGIMHKDLRRNFYLYHHYEFSEQLQLYNELIYNRKNNSFVIKQEDDGLLDFIAAFDYDASEDFMDYGTTKKKYREKSRVSMKSLGNEIGIKGDLEPFRLFYSLYYRLENIHLNYDFSKPSSELTRDPLAARLIGRKEAPLLEKRTDNKGKKDEHEYYLGCNTRFNLTKQRLHKLYLDGEFLLSEASKGYHQVQVTYRNKFIKLAYNSIKHKPPYLVTYGYSNYRKWNKHLMAPSAQHLAAEVYYAFPYVRISPTLSLKRIKNHIYYKKVTKRGEGLQLRNSSSILDDHCISEPMQATFPIYLLSYGGNLDFCFFTYFHIENDLTFLKDLSTSQYKIFKGYIPPYMYTGRYYYAHRPFGKKMDIETGMNIHFKDLYYADGYDIVAQQFYRQNQFAVQGRAILDLFVNFRINNVKLSLKYSYINEDWCSPKAYFVTPFYPGQRKAADLGIHWSFFD